MVLHWGHTRLFFLRRKGRKPITSACFLFNCGTQLSSLHLGKCQTSPTLHPTTSPTEISGLEGGEKKMFFTERLDTKNMSVILI